MQPHRIHLRGPWEYEWRPLADAGDMPRTGRVKMPASWQDLFGDGGGSAVFRRRFNKPTNLELHERVSLVFDGIGGTGRVELNGREVGTLVTVDHATRFEVTPLLQESNELCVVLTWDPLQGGDQAGRPWSSLVIEIGV